MPHYLLPQTSAVQCWAMQWKQSCNSDMTACETTVSWVSVKTVWGRTLILAAAHDATTERLEAFEDILVLHFICDDRVLVRTHL